MRQKTATTKALKASPALIFNCVNITYKVSHDFTFVKCNASFYIRKRRKKNELLETSKSLAKTAYSSEIAKSFSDIARINFLFV